MPKWPQMGPEWCRHMVWIMRRPHHFHRIHLNITEEQRNFLARRGFVEHTSMADVAREILEEERKREERRLGVASSSRSGSSTPEELRGVRRRATRIGELRP